MGRFTLALGYIITGDERYLAEYNNSFKHLPLPPPQQPPPSKEWLKLVNQNVIATKPNKEDK